MRLAKSNEHMPVNIGNPNEFTILECAEQVLKVTGSKSKIRYEALPPDDPKQRRPDITKARQLLGWDPIDRSRNRLANVSGLLQKGCRRGNETGKVKIKVEVSERGSKRRNEAAA